MKNNVRKIVKEVLSEMEMAIGGGGFDSNNDLAQFHGYPDGYGEFPHLHPDLPSELPSSSEINQLNSDKMKDFITNDETYEFPMEEFKKGLEAEVDNYKKNKTVFNWFDVANIVLNNLKKDKNYYQDGAFRDS
jgi:hypothetical protein